MRVRDLPTPALVVDRAGFDDNVAAMGAVNPGRRLRPHVKAFKSTALAAELAAAGHDAFCCATAAEVLGMAAAGLGADLLLANELVDPQRLGALAGLHRSGRARVTVAVDSEATVDAAARAGLEEVLVDVNVGLPRCGCPPERAGELAERARARGLVVRGVMGYEGQVTVLDDRDVRQAEVDRAMALLLDAHAAVGGDVISAGSTVDFDQNTWATEIQAGTFVLMDTAFAALGLPFRCALHLIATVISVDTRWAVCDAGLKALGMDHGNPDLVGGRVLLVSDEHITFRPDDGRTVTVGERVELVPAHLDPTVARHEVLWVADGPGLDAEVVDRWPVDLRHW